MSDEPRPPPDPSAVFDASPSLHVRNLAFTLVSIAVVILLLQFMQSVIIPFVFSALLFYALDPAVDWLQRKHVPRAIGTAVMLLLVVSGCGALTYSLQCQALAVVDELPTGARRLTAFLKKRPGTEPSAVEKVQQAADTLQEAENSAPPTVS